MSELKTRKFNLKRGEDGSYIIPSKGMIAEWKITSDVKNVKLYFGTKLIDVPRSNNKVINFKEIREYIRNIMMPQTERETDLLSLERLFFSWQLTSFEFYKSLTDSDFENSIFTRDIPQIRLLVQWNGNKGELLVEETYYDRSKEEECVRLMT